MKAISKSRRSFLKKSLIAGASLSIVPRYVLGKGYVAPSDKINIALIGCGKKSPGIARTYAKNPNAQMVAASDLFPHKIKEYQNILHNAYATSRGKNEYESVAAYLNYEEMLERDDIDGVVVASPDHWHSIHAIHAIKKGKDVYCEKPLAHTIKEGRDMVKATEKYNRILQTGSQQRSGRNFRHACELVRNGYIGEVQKVLVNVGDPAIAYNLEAEDIPTDFNWDNWCGPSPVGNYNHRLAPPQIKTDFWPDWRLFREYGGGIISDWGAHMFDIAQWGLGMDESGPMEFIPPSEKGATRGLKMVYANGVEMYHEDFGRGWAVRFIGSKGSIDVSRKFLDSNPANLVSAEIKAGETRLYDTGGDHTQDWLDAMKSRKDPICNVETGHRTSSICCAANIAYRLGRPLKWDPAKEKFNDGEANKLRKKKMRKPYTI